MWTKQLRPVLTILAICVAVNLAVAERPSPPASMASVPGVEVGVNHNDNRERLPEFSEYLFRDAAPGHWPVPPLAGDDLANGIEPVLISGEAHALSGPLTVLTDGIGQLNQDDPSHSFFAKNVQQPARIRISLPVASSIDEIHLYSWHRYALSGGTRAPQLVDVYAGCEGENGFAVDDPLSPGYVRLASIDTRKPGDADAQSGQHGSSVHRADGSPLGEFQHFIFDVHPPVNDADHTFLGEIDIVAASAPPQPAPTTVAARHFDQHIAPLLAARCLECHNTSDLKGGLDLSRLETTLTGGDSGPALVPGQVDESNLLERVDAEDMPPKHPLSAEEKSTLREWIASGAEWGTSPIDRFQFSSSARAGFDWWSLQPITRPQPPQVKDQAWVAQPIDAFVLAKLEEKGLPPSPPADRRTLIRRLTFDLHGLPPTADEVAAFEADKDPKSYEKLVDRLLDSPHYGERWARHWLDVVRYAESQGFERNKFYPSAWRFRDWVITAMNADMPYDEFVRLQLAGDVLQPDDPTALIAASYLSVGPHDMLGLTQGSLAMKENTREDELENVVGNVSQTFLALTVNCARCHDHKFDPIYQREFYELASAFGGLKRTLRDSPPRDYHQDRDLRLAMGPAYAKLRESLGPDGEELLDAARLETITAAEASVTALEEVVDKAQKKVDKAKDANTQAVLDDRQRDLRAAQDLLTSVQQPFSMIVWDTLSDKLSAEQRAAADPWVMQLSRLEQSVCLRWGGSIQTVESGPPRFFYLQKRGNFRTLGEVVAPEGLACVREPAFGEHLSPGAPEGERRIRMAQWITDLHHPLTARVIANRMWHYHFGVGLVDTPNDFGFSGGRPTHPELLDYLASALIDGGWSLKHLHREIVLSATYRQSATPNPAAKAIDTDNRLLWRWTPQRLDAETLRDSVLAVSGRLNPRMGGPSFRDVQPSASADNVAYAPSAAFDGAVNRRSVYRTVARASTPPLLDSFDCADPTIATPRRAVTTTPLQALTLLNSSFMSSASAAFADRVTVAAGEDIDHQVESVYQIALNRSPTSDESASAVAFVGKFGLPEFCLLVLNSNEFLYID